MQIWRLIDTGPANAATNMALDEAIGVFCRQGQAPTTLRFYTWLPATLSIGYFQNVDREVDLNRCRSQGYGFVRRPTGGKAVLHDQELTYSISAKSDDPLFPKDLHGSFLVIARALIRGLQGLGIKAEIFGQESLRKRPSGSHTTQACFLTAMGYEIGANGKKLVGSAQRRWRDGFLQHGSILIDFAPDPLFDLFKFADDQQRRRAVAEASQTVTSLSSVLQQRLEIASLKEEIMKGFEENLKIRLVPSPLTASELKLSHTLIEKKYGTDAWNLHRRQEAATHQP